MLSRAGMVEKKNKVLSSFNPGWQLSTTQPLAYSPLPQWDWGRIGRVEVRKKLIG